MIKLPGQILVSYQLRLSMEHRELRVKMLNPIMRLVFVCTHSKWAVNGL